MLSLLADDTSSISWGVWLFSLVIALVFAAWCAAIARRKGRSQFLWAVLGFFFTLIALIIVLILPRTARGDAQRV